MYEKSTNFASAALRIEKSAAPASYRLVEKSEGLVVRAKPACAGVRHYYLVVGRKRGRRRSGRTVDVISRRRGQPVRRETPL